MVDSTSLRHPFSTEKLIREVIVLDILFLLFIHFYFDAQHTLIFFFLIAVVDVVYNEMMRQRNAGVHELGSKQNESANGTPEHRLQY